MEKKIEIAEAFASHLIAWKNGNPSKSVTLYSKWERLCSMYHAVLGLSDRELRTETRAMAHAFVEEVFE